jgi:hypothetical protein
LLTDLFKTEPEPRSIPETILSVKAWLATSPKDKWFSVLIKEGPKDVFGCTIILLGIIAKYTLSEDGSIQYTSYSDPSTPIPDAKTGFEDFLGLREVSQALFFQFGGVQSWMFRDLLPDETMQYNGCTECKHRCAFWWTNMRNFRRELENRVVNNRMVFWVA